MGFRHARVSTSTKQVHKRDVIGLYRLFRLHFLEKLDRIFSSAVHCEPTNHTVPRRNSFTRQLTENFAGFFDTPAFTERVDYSRGQLVVDVDPTSLYVLVNRLGPFQRAEARASR
ncbi:sulfate adenylyltransferase subunit 1 [Striga asiatica]|uniref:Sulfate adenylyltransferase subunit 1 n=1 Tax=Striga asiatica TaxID=4170 RepID=A0A5A7RJ74_STRAF|nr:sulfate adenylyltransferase subunit 1 [Striga asiatica]